MPINSREICDKKGFSSTYPEGSPPVFKVSRVKTSCFWRTTHAEVAFKSSFQFQILILMVIWKGPQHRKQVRHRSLVIVQSLFCYWLPEKVGRTEILYVVCLCKYTSYQVNACNLTLINLNISNLLILCQVKEQKCPRVE